VRHALRSSNEPKSRSLLAAACGDDNVYAARSAWRKLIRTFMAANAASSFTAETDAWLRARLRKEHFCTLPHLTSLSSLLCISDIVAARHH